MAARAYVLISVEPGTVGEVAKSLRKIPGVSSADVVAGSYDVVAVLDQPDVRDVGHVVMDAMHGVPGLKSTTTLVVVA